jgi:hypothetical protein
MNGTFVAFCSGGSANDAQRPFRSTSQTKLKLQSSTHFRDMASDEQKSQKGICLEIHDSFQIRETRSKIRSL